MHRGLDVNERDSIERRRASARRTAVLLAIVAIAFYFGIMLAVGQF